MNIITASTFMAAIGDVGRFADRKKIRAGAPKHKGVKPGTWAVNKAMRSAERELALQAEVAYKRTVADWKRTQAKRKGAGATSGRAS